MDSYCNVGSGDQLVTSGARQPNDDRDGLSHFGIRSTRHVVRWNEREERVRCQTDGIDRPLKRQVRVSVNVHVNRFSYLHVADVAFVDIRQHVWISRLDNVG